MAEIPPLRDDHCRRLGCPGRTRRTDDRILCRCRKNEPDGRIRCRLAGNAHGATFPHALHLEPLGGAARQAITLGKDAGYGAALECASCHRQDASGKGFQPIEMERDCGSCHSLAYARDGGQIIASDLKEIGIDQKLDSRIDVLPHSDQVNTALATYSDYIRTETQALALELNSQVNDGADVELDEFLVKVKISVQK